VIYLLDTNIVSQLARDPKGPAAQAVRRVGSDQVATSIIVAAELRYGVSKKPGDARLGERIAAILAALTVHPLEAPVDALYGEIRAELERRGQVIGGNDLLIAAQALTLGAVMVTDNVGEFERVPGLVVENWLRLS
jgi:tRNA(fMet)-specific endonuclease VapC